MVIPPGSPPTPLPPSLTHCCQQEADCRGWIRKHTAFTLLGSSFAHKMHVHTKRSRMGPALSADFHMTFPGKPRHQGRSDPGRQTADWRRNTDGCRGARRPFPKTFMGHKAKQFLSSGLSELAVKQLILPILKLQRLSQRPWTPAPQHTARRALDQATRMIITRSLWVSDSRLTCQNLCWVTFVNCVHF